MKKFYLFAAMAAGMTLASCNNDENVESAINDNIKLQVENVGLKTVNSRAGITATSFTNGETLGLYIYRGNVGDYTAYNDGAAGLPTENVPYYENNGDWTQAQPIVLSNVKGYVYAYYPYNAENNGSTDIKTTVLETQGDGQSDGTVDEDQADYMYATPVADKSNVDYKVELEMNHALAMVSFKFVQTTDATLIYPGEGKVSKIVLKNKTGKTAIQVGEATMDLATGVFSNFVAAANGITLTPNATESLMDVDYATYPEKMPRLLLYPVAAVAADDAEVTITVDGNDYTMPIPAIATGYKAGFNYHYTFTLKGTGLELTTVSIKEWIPENVTGGDIQKPDTQI